MKNVRLIFGVVLNVGIYHALGITVRGVDTATTLAHAGLLRESYDYVIAGGGQSGLTVADRLTEDPNTTVLVIEYGELGESPLISSLETWMQLQTDGLEFFYNISSVPQVNLRNRSTSVLVGKVVGGGSAVNAMMTIRGTREDYDRWATYFNDGKAAGWSWNGLLPYFKKAVHFVQPDPAVAKDFKIQYNTTYWGNTSGVYAGWPSYQYPGIAALVDAWKLMPGVEMVQDSGAGIPGLYWYPTFMSPVNKTRSYAKTGHYDNLRRSNYHLLTGSKVTRLLVNGTTAYGVAFAPAGGGSNFVKVKANKEVILAAGAIHTPKIMQLSGLGPKTLLDMANIRTVVDLPGVGQNFQDHPILQSTFAFQNFPYPVKDNLTNNATFRAWADTLWAANKTGPLTIAAGNVAAWLPFPVISHRSQEIATGLLRQDPATQLPLGTHPTVVAGYKAQMESLASALRGNKTAFVYLGLGSGATNGLIVDLHPLSRGTVNIDLRNPDDLEPLVDYRAMSNPFDGVIMADILRYAKKYYIENPSFTAFRPQQIAPPPNVTADEEYVDYLAGALRPSLFHPSGTCAMMPRDLGGVVDHELKVYGVKGLRIVDASIISSLVGANTCQTVYAVAEKAADLIKADSQVYWG